MERETGIEPATNSLEGCDSTTELLPPPQSSGADDRDRTGDLVLTKDALYQLSYIGRAVRGSQFCFPKNSLPSDVNFSCLVRQPAEAAANSLELAKGFEPLTL